MALKLTNRFVKKVNDVVQQNSGDENIASSQSTDTTLPISSLTSNHVVADASPQTSNKLTKRVRFNLNEKQQNSAIEYVTISPPPDASLPSSMSNPVVADASPQISNKPTKRFVKFDINENQKQSATDDAAISQPPDVYLPPSTSNLSAPSSSSEKPKRRFIKPMNKNDIIQQKFNVDNVVAFQPNVPPFMPSVSPTVLTTTNPTYVSPGGNGNWNKRGDQQQRGNYRGNNAFNGGRTNAVNQQNRFDNYGTSNRFPKRNEQSNGRGRGGRNSRFGSNFKPGNGNRRRNQNDGGFNCVQIFQTDVEFNAANGHDACVIFNKADELASPEKDEMKLMEDEFKREAQTNFSSFLQNFFSNVNFVYEIGNRKNLLSAFIRQELRKCLENASYLPRIIIFTKNKRETSEVFNVIENATQDIPCIALSAVSSIEYIEDATEKLYDERIKILVVRDLYFLGKNFVYCDKVVSFSLPVDVEDFFLRFRNIKKCSEFVNFMETEIEMSILYQFIEAFKASEIDIPAQLNLPDAAIDLPCTKNCPPVREMLQECFEKSEQEYKVMHPLQKYEECCRYLGGLGSNPDSGQPRVLIFTNNDEETLKLETYLKERQIFCVSLNYGSSEAEIHRIVNNFTARSFYVLIVSGCCIVEKDFFTDVVINFSMLDTAERYGMRLHKIRHERCITYVSCYNDRFILRNISTLLESCDYKIPALKYLLTWCNCGSYKIDQYEDIQIVDNHEDDTAMLIARTSKQILTLEDRQKSEACYEIIKNNFNRVRDMNLMPKTLIIIKTQKEAEELDDLLNCCVYPSLYVKSNTAEFISQIHKFPIIIADSNVCDDVINLDYSYLIHYVLPDDIEEYLSRLKRIKHEHSVVFATKGKDAAIMERIVNILSVSSYMGYCINAAEVDESQNENHLFGTGELESAGDDEMSTGISIKTCQDEDIELGTNDGKDRDQNDAVQDGQKEDHEVEHDVEDDGDW